MNNRPLVAINALSAAFLAALAAQVLHEVAHGIAAALVGAEWQALHLFAALWNWPDAPNENGALIVEGSPALLNILTGFLAVFLFGRAIQQKSAMPALFWRCFAGYSLFMGFGYLFVDPLFYQPGGE